MYIKFKSSTINSKFFSENFNLLIPKLKSFDISSLLFLILNFSKLRFSIKKFELKKINESFAEGLVFSKELESKKNLRSMKPFFKSIFLNSYFWLKIALVKLIGSSESFDE